MDAAFELLSADPHASMSAVARAAGVGRVTLYAHFSSREALLTAVLARAVALATAALDSQATDAGTAREALARLLRPAWQVLDRCQRLTVATAHGLPSACVNQVQELLLGRVESVITRGREEGDFRLDVPTAWLVAATFSLMEAAADEVDAGRLSAEEAGPVLERTLLAAIERR